MCEACKLNYIIQVSNDTLNEIISSQIMIIELTFDMNNMPRIFREHYTCKRFCIYFKINISEIIFMMANT